MNKSKSSKVFESNFIIIEFQCKKTNSSDTYYTCDLNFETTFLYVSLGLYIIMYHLVLLNLIIATFT